MPNAMDIDSILTYKGDRGDTVYFTANEEQSRVEEILVRRQRNLSLGSAFSAAYHKVSAFTRFVQWKNKRKASINLEDVWPEVPCKKADHYCDMIKSKPKRVRRQPSRNL